MSKISRPRGTEDLLFEDTDKWHILEDIIKKAAFKYNFKEIRTPLFESTDLFVRGVGETTDVVSKEMYTFDDKKGRSLTLRPEGTAACVRAYIEHKMFGYGNQPVKMYYMGPMFRYERPQKGRQRQFHQFGVEVLGIKSPQVDAETILLGLDICQEIGLKNLKVLINTLGDNESREVYRNNLKEYFSNYTDQLCSDCINRLDKNPLRLLDCKVDHDKDFMKKAPTLSDFLNDESKEYFQTVLEILNASGIEYEIDERLVRGLDYYTDTIYEVVSTNKESGAQATLFGGGRYDGLSASLGGPDVSGVGFGMGLERILISANVENPELFMPKPLDVFVMPLDKSIKTHAFTILEKLRNVGINAEMEYNDKSFKSMFKYCERNKIKYAILIGEKEYESQTIILKDLENNTQEELSHDWLELVSERIEKNGKNT